jgi:hypothetical protein
VRALALLLALALPSVARAEDPVTHIGVVAGARANVGAFGRVYGLGWIIGTDAGISFGPIGASWSLQYGELNADDPGEVYSTVGLMEMNFVARLRIRMPVRGTEDVPSFLFFDGSLDLLRASSPIPPDDAQIYVGPSAGLGLEVVLGNVVLSLGTRYGMFVGGPSGLKLLFGVGFQSR